MSPDSDNVLAQELPPPRTAAALVIGNELLSGKVQDVNIARLGEVLYGLGIVLRRVVMTPDDITVIASDLDDLRRTHDLVFTSGGVGPTHDDVTLDALARAFGSERVRSERLAALLRGHFRERLTEAHLRMADLPGGAVLIGGGAGRWPTVRVENVYVLPGVPTIFRRKLDQLASHLAGGAPFLSQALETDCDEGVLAPLLHRIVGEHPRVSVGSYPRFIGEGTNVHAVVRVTVDGREPAAIAAAMAALEAGLHTGGPGTCHASRPDRSHARTGEAKPGEEEQDVPAAKPSRGAP